MRTERGAPLGPFLIEVDGDFTYAASSSKETIEDAIEGAKNLLEDGTAAQPEDIGIWARVPVQFTVTVDAQIEGERK